MSDSSHPPPADAAAAVRKGKPRKNVPTLRMERQLLRQGARLVAGMDEVGRGALAGPVTVGVCVVDAGTRTVPSGVKDSKLVPELRRPQLADAVRDWAVATGVGHASPAEIDEVGMTRALRLAGQRALADAAVAVDVVILDGKHDWLTDPESSGLLGLLHGDPGYQVVTKIKADMQCSCVAGASLVAKVARDAILVDLARTQPGYGWEINKGYSAPEHLAAIETLGASDYHRRSWKTFQDRLQPPP